MLLPVPRMLLMDEPFGSPDDSTRSELQAMIVGLWCESAFTDLFVRVRGTLTRKQDPD